MYRVRLSSPASLIGSALTAALLCLPVVAQDAADPPAQRGGGFLRRLGNAVNQGLEQGANGAQGAVDGINQAQTALRGQIRGQVTMADGNVLTCKVGEQAGGILGNDGLFRAIPLAVPLPNGQVHPNLCDELAKAGVLVLADTSVSPRAGGKPADFVAFESTELSGIFERFPQPGGGRIAEWPRVAITLLEEPAWGGEKPNAYGFKYPDVSCWTFRAKVWESAQASRDIPRFHICSDAVPRWPGGDTAMTYQVWGGIVGRQATPGSTGILRTEGPLWPDNPLPVGKPREAVRVNPATFTGDVLSKLLYNTGVDFTLPQEHRVWLNLGPPDQLPAGWTPAATGAAPAQPTADLQALQQQTAQGFAAIQSQALAATPTRATAPASADQLAADGGRLCGLSAADMLVLRDTAMTFVRLERSSGAIVMSELVDGARTEVALDGPAFASRAGSVSADLGKGGMSCGRAFWNAEAVKAATAAMQ